MSLQEELFSKIDAQEVEQQIKNNQKQFDFDIREYPIEIISMKFDPTKQDPEFFIPDYQRDFVWSEKQKSLFIESLLIGLPIPYLFVADVEIDENPYTEGNVEVIDGAQRMQTIYAYLNNELELIGMERLSSLENTIFRDLPPARQKRFNRTTVRLIELKNIDEDGRRLMFDRLNSGGTKLTDIEKWIGTINSEFIIFIKKLSENSLFKELTPLPQSKLKRKERILYVLRFFVYRDRYQNFGKRTDGTSDSSVINFINDYINDIVEVFDEEKKQNLENQFIKMLDFVKTNFKNGFRKSRGSKSVSRIRFEAMAVGSSIVVDEHPNIKPSDTSWAYKNPEFLKLIRSDASNSRIKVINRIEFVKNHLLGIEEDGN